MEAVSTTMWLVFGGLVLVMLAVDLLVFGRRPHEVTMREAVGWSVVWLAIGLGFTAVVWQLMDEARAGQYVTGYLIERSLSLDNLFVFALIFSYFAVPAAYQQRVLLWGVLGALVLRAVMIFAGIALIERFDWVMYIFGAFLVVTGIKMAKHDGDAEVHPERNPVLRLVRRMLPATNEYHGHSLFVRHKGMLMATPLLAVFAVVATTDVVFALDSIPAIFAITTDPFLVLTANVFALLGLRALYFVLAGMMERFPYLQIGLSVVLVFVGIKMLIANFYHLPIAASLAFIAAVLGISIGVSLYRTRDMGVAPSDDVTPAIPPLDDLEAPKLATTVPVDDELSSSDPVASVGPVAGSETAGDDRS